MSSTDLQRHPAALRALIGVTLSAALFGSLHTADTPVGSVYLMGMHPLGTQTGAPANVFTNTWVLALPPWALTQQSYAPLVDYLSRVSGKRVIFDRPADWHAYQRGMRHGKYDLAFDGAHLASWRITHGHHQPLIRISTPVRFVAVVSHDDISITRLPDLAGRRLCAPPPPDVGTLSLYQHFDNPARRPLLVRVGKGEQAYAKMIAGACEAALLPMDVYLQTNHLYSRAVFKTLEMPGETFTAGPRLNTEDLATLASALLSPEGQAAIRSLYAGAGDDDTFQVVPAMRSEYAGLDAILRSVWGFDS